MLVEQRSSKDPSNNEKAVVVALSVAVKYCCCKNWRTLIGTPLRFIFITDQESKESIFKLLKNIIGKYLSETVINNLGKVIEFQDKNVFKRCSILWVMNEWSLVVYYLFMLQQFIFISTIRLFTSRPLFSDNEVGCKKSSSTICCIS